MQLHQLLPKRKIDSHKYDYGHVLIVGGSSGMSGSVVLASSAALKSGCGLVTAAVPECIDNVVACKLTEVMTLALSSSNGCMQTSALSSIDDYIEKRKVNVVAIGCGMSRAESTEFIVNKLLKYGNTPLVVDADALTALSKDVSILKEVKSPVVLTPHLAEFSRISGYSIEEIKKSTKKLAKEYALMYNVCLVLKGNNTIVTDGVEIFESSTGNPGMATAGSGDVLTGIITGLIAQGVQIFDASMLGVRLHGMAGDYAADEKTEYCMVASDIVDCLACSFKEMLGKKKY